MSHTNLVPISPWEKCDMIDRLINKEHMKFSFIKAFLLFWGFLFVIKALFILVQKSGDGAVLVPQNIIYKKLPAFRGLYTSFSAIPIGIARIIQFFLKATGFICVSTFNFFMGSFVQAAEYDPTLNNENYEQTTVNESFARYIKEENNTIVNELLKYKGLLEKSYREMIELNATLDKIEETRVKSEDLKTLLKELLEQEYNHTTGIKDIIEQKVADLCNTYSIQRPIPIKDYPPQKCLAAIDYVSFDYTFSLPYFVKKIELRTTTKRKSQIEYYIKDNLMGSFKDVEFNDNIYVFNTPIYADKIVLKLFSNTAEVCIPHIVFYEPARFDVTNSK